MRDDRPVVCVIPAFRAARTAPAVVRGLRRSLPRAVVIGIDDGSDDHTADVLRAESDETIVFPANRGKGAALRAGLARALDVGAAAVLTIDADGQHDARSAPALVSALGDADLVVGSRARAGSAMPLGRRVTNTLSNLAVSHLAGRRLPDTQSGFRAMTADVVRTVRPAGDRYEFEIEFLLGAARKGYRIASVPIATVYGGRSRSHFRPLRDGFRVAREFWRFSHDIHR